MVGLELDGREMPLEEGGFQRLTMISNKRMATTTVEIVVSDFANFFEHEVTLSDGTPLTLKVGRDISNFKTYQFRVYKYQKTAQGGCATYQIWGYWDSPRWWLQTTRTPIQQTSAQAIRQLAEACDLATDIDDTDDFQVWLPNNTRYCQFARDICANGYLDDQSFMQLAQTLDGQIRYRNLSATRNDDQIVHFVHGGVDDLGQNRVYTVYDHKNIGASGYGNALGGYKHVLREQNVITDVATTDQVQIRRVSQDLMVNRAIHQSLENGRVDHSLINAGNVHDNYFRAAYQNERSAMLYSAGVELLLSDQTEGLDVLDWFEYQAADPPSMGRESTNSSFKGRYICTAKAIHIDSGNYYEKVQGYSTGLNADPDNENSQL